MRHPIALYPVLMVVVFVASEARGQVVVYSQPNDNPNGPCSDGVPDQFCGVRIADNFVLSDPVNRKITEVTWWGSSDYFEHDDLTNFTDWVITFYEDDANLPAAPIYTETVPIGATDPNETGILNMFGGKEYRQTASLAAPVTLYIDQTYWISIGAIADDPAGDVWIWSVNYFQGDNHSAVDDFSGAGYVAREGDVAFELIGEPGAGCPRAGCDPGDIDGDCVVDLSDLATLLAHYRETGGPEEGDLNGDGKIDLADLAILLSVYRNDCRY